MNSKTTETENFVLLSTFESGLVNTWFTKDNKSVCS